jgi:predicted metal-dependent hydrolase
MNQSRSLGRKSVDEIDPTKLRELTFTNQDWEDFNRGIQLFNAGKFWHAHEAWEQVWRRHHEDSRLFMQGLIQMAAAFHLLAGC